MQYKLFKKISLMLFSALLLSLTLYSYALVDPNITFINHEWWIQYREAVVKLGYYQRAESWRIYVSMIAILFLFHFYFVKFYKRHSVKSLVIIIAVTLLFAYPFLSHDLFNYMFDARIFTHYGDNPYLKKALDYPQDDWLRFMHWTHRTYPYGPVYLILSFIPSFLSLGKFSLGFVFFKGMNIIFFAIAAYFLQKMHKQWAVFFITNPFILIEGLVSTHNDLIYVSLGIIGVYYLLQADRMKSRFFFVSSILIKYLSLPLILLSKKNWLNWNLIVLLLQISTIIYVSMQNGWQQWYFMALFIFLPIYPRFVAQLNILFLGLLLSYYPYIRIGGWAEASNVQLKNTIIFVSFAVTIIYLLFDKVSKRKKMFRMETALQSKFSGQKSSF